MVGATATKYELTSEWVDGKRATVTVIGVGPALGVGADVTTARSCVAFNEPLEFIKPDLFNGRFISDQVGWAVLWAGYGSGVTQLGDAWSIAHGKIDFGWDASWSLTVGTSTVMDVKWEER
ncbi:hypothetical protein KDX31_15890 [Amphritea atlantica]|uniref:Uncharacterized protein n=1 Tax=Amphritea atlantica TaxID=355243 RepID=A0ABY5GTQ8_9GAMM|nr:hypothetical protein KDX31_15890 [Amphritea atlantica]